MASKFTGLFLAILILLQYSGAAVAQTPALSGTATSSDAVDVLTKQLILKAIELGRFNLCYRLEASKEPRFRELRYASLQQGSASCGLASSIIAMNELGENLNTPHLVTRARLRDSFNVGLVSPILGGSSSALELTSNFMRAVHNRSQGYDAGSAIAYVKKTVGELDEVIARREQVVAQLPAGDHREQLELESRIIRQLRAYQLQSFIQHLGNMSQYTTSENAFYGLNTASNGVGLVGAICLLKGLKTPKYGGSGTVLTLIASSVATGTPALATALSKCSKRHAERLALAALGEEPKFDPAQLESDLNLLRQRTSPQSARLTERIAVWTGANAKLDASIASETKIANEFDKVALQNNALAPLIGGASVAAGVSGLRAYYKYQKHIKTFTDAEKAIGFNYAAYVIGTSAAGFTVGSNAAMMALSLIYSRKLEREKRAPRILLEQQLSYLDELERKLH